MCERCVEKYNMVVWHESQLESTDGETFAS
jgi:hypothetical protein